MSTAQEHRTGAAVRAVVTQRHAPAEPAKEVRTSRRRRARGPAPEAQESAAISAADWRRPRVRVTTTLLHSILFVALMVTGLGPLLWMAKSAITPTRDTLTTPMALFPNGFAWENLWIAWNEVHVGTYFLNTVFLAIGCWAVQMIVATTAGYALSVLRPRYGPMLTSLVLCTLFVPSVVLLVPLYLTVLDPPLLHQSLINTFWAVWLPSGASAFNIVLVKKFFDNLPREIFEAAKTDGAGPYRVFWSIVLPMSKAILGVVSVFAIIASWKDFLWPMLVLPDIEVQPLSVRLPAIETTTDLGVFIAALAISTLIPVILFLLFQKTFLNSAGLGGAVKG